MEMGTKAFIGIKSSTGFRGVHCTSDGGVGGVGRMLPAHFDKTRTERLIAMGHISRLNVEFGEKHAFTNSHKIGTIEFEEECTLRDSVCTFFHRDRGDSLDIYDEPTLERMPQTLMHIEHVYNLGDDEIWRTCSVRARLQPW